MGGVSKDTPSVKIMVLWLRFQIGRRVVLVSLYLFRLLNNEELDSSWVKYD